MRTRSHHGAGLLLAVMLAGSATAQAGDRNGWDYPYFPERLMPEADAPIQADGKLTGRGDDDSIGGTLMGRVPLYQAPDWYLMLQGDGHADWYDQGDEQAWGADLGLILRGAFDANNAWGLNAFVDLGGEAAFAGQGSLGLEYEYVSDGGMSLRAGGNLYVPFRDYGGDADFLRAPRLGGDLYLGIGQDIRWHRLELFVTGFHYAETDEIEGLSGATVEAEWRYAGLDFLPDGSHLYVALGGRWDTLDSEISPIGRLGIAFPLGNDGSKDRVAEIRRNIAYGSAFVPLKRKPKAAASDSSTADCGPGLPPRAEEFSARLDLENGGPETIVQSGRVADHIGEAARLQACDGFSGCADALGAIPAPFGVNLDQQAYFFKPADSCDSFSGIVVE
jgi:hypothetical protein